MQKSFFSLTLLSSLLSLLFMGSLRAQDPSIQLPDIEIIGTTPLPGSGVPVEDVPSKVQTFDSEELQNSYSLDLSSMLESKAGGVSTVEVQNNPFQKGINYRGYTSAPLLGEPQGLAVYQNGVRVNEPFGDVMQWDLLPEPALARADILSSNPVFGLNALGGAIALQLKNGFDFQGIRVNTHTGYFGRHGTDMEFGFSGETLAIYAALDIQQDAGWRNRSRSDIQKSYLNLGYRGDDLNLTWDFIQANNNLNGNGLAPTELLESNRRAVFTWPDNTANDLLSTGLSGNYFINDIISVQANAYYRRMFRKTLNADEVEAEACSLDSNETDIDADTDAGNQAIAALSQTLARRIDTNNGITSAGGGVNFLCEEEEEDEEIELLVDSNGLPITEFSGKYAAANTSSTMTKGWGFGVQTEITESIMDLDNKFIIGGSADYGLTRFHQESYLTGMSADRTLLDVEGDFPFVNFATLEIEFDSNSVDEVALEVGEAAPTKMQAHNRYYGVYSTDTIYLNDDLAVTLGGRFNIARITLDDEFQTDITNATITRKGDLNGSHRFARFNPSAGATYDFSDWNITGYVNYAESNRAPSPVELSCADPAVPCRVPNAFAADPPLEQVVSQGWEFGLHGNIDRAALKGLTPLDWSITGFAFNNNDDIYFVSSGVGLGSGYFKNVGGTRRVGGDITLSGRLGLVEFDTNYSFIEATFENAFSVASESHPNRVNKQVAVEAGDEIPGIPQHTLKLGLNYEPKKDWLLGLDMISRSGMYLRGDEGNFLPRTSGHTIFNMQTSYQVTEWVQLYGLIDNIFDTQYETFGQLGETGTAVLISELPEGVKEPRFLSPGQPFGAFVGLRISLN
ncbi:MAG: hypothetical protein CMM32_10200 [Rhodospirillaceae bacterium]|nr:hypothetical protein [Rhodospirillaceae bacterium]